MNGNSRPGLLARSAILTLAIAGVMALGLVGCSGGDPRDAVDRYVGKADDHSYAGMGGRVVGANVNGDQISLEDFKGKYLWVDYTAPWCPPCNRQAPIIASLEKRHAKKVVFLTVLTSDNKPMKLATDKTAKNWSRKFKLSPDHVVAGRGNFSGMVIPQHFLFSPSGQTLYRHKGLLFAGHIEEQVAEHTKGWKGEVGDDVFQSDVFDF
jgi:thiol-disulfide isomerase/thioredoxin